MGNASKKQVKAILRRTAERAERAKTQSVTCPNPTCRTRIEPWWRYCAMCGAVMRSYADPPFACPPDETAG